jgi:hypothetical protein
MGLFSRTKKSPDCPICGEDLSAVRGEDKLQHFFLNHVDDVVRGDPGSGLELHCGCPEMRWSTDDFRTWEILPHLERVHQMKV